MLTELTDDKILALSQRVKLRVGKKDNHKPQGRAKSNVTPLTYDTETVSDRQAQDRFCASKLSRIVEVFANVIMKSSVDWTSEKNLKSEDVHL